VPARGPALPGFTAESFFFRADMPLWQSTYVVNAPALLGLEVDAHGMGSGSAERQGNRIVLRATRRDVPPLLPEPGAPGDAEQLPFLQVGAGATTETLARAIGDALVDSYRPTMEIRELADEIRSSAGSERGDALVRAAYRRIAERVLGGGGFDEPASAILSRGSGNRTVVLKAVLGALGVRARLALVRDFTRDPARYRFPRPDQWSYAVLRVENGDEVIWLDPTNRLSAYGVLAGSLRDAEAVVVPEPGEAAFFTRTPADGTEADRRRAAIDITVDADGGATISGREEYRGFAASALRGALEQLDAASRRQMTEQALARSFRAPSLEALEFEGEREPEALLLVRYRARVERWARRDGGRAIVETPLLPARLGARFLRLATRERILLIGADERISLSLQVQLPPGWSPVAVADVDLSTSYGTYRRRERAGGGTLQREESFDLLRARIAPEEYPAFASWARAVDASQRRPLLFEVAPAQETVGTLGVEGAGKPGPRQP
jgi:hypothetical protein